MVGAFEATRAAYKTAGSLPNGAADIVLSLSDEEAAVLPPLEHDADDRSGWITFDKPLLYLYAGQGPYVGRCVSVARSSGSVQVLTPPPIPAT